MKGLYLPVGLLKLMIDKLHIILLNTLPIFLCVAILTDNSSVDIHHEGSLIQFL